MITQVEMECNKDMTSQVLLERRRNNENGINRKIDRMLQEEKVRKIITELSREMIAWKRQWLDLARTNEQYKRENTVEGLKGDYQRTIEHTENMMAELDNLLFGSSFDSVYHGLSLNSKTLKLCEDNRNRLFLLVISNVLICGMFGLTASL